MTKTQILGKLRQRDGCGNREEVERTVPDEDYDWADDETLGLDESMQIFEALGPDIDVTGAPNGLTFAYTATTTVPTFDFVATTKTETVIITPEAVPIGREYARTA